MDTLSLLGAHAKRVPIGTIPARKRRLAVNPAQSRTYAVAPSTPPGSLAAGALAVRQVRWTLSDPRDSSLPCGQWFW